MGRGKKKGELYYPQAQVMLRNNLFSANLQDENRLVLTTTDDNSGCCCGGRRVYQVSGKNGLILETRHPRNKLFDLDIYAQPNDLVAKISRIKGRKFNVVVDGGTVILGTITQVITGCCCCISGYWAFVDVASQTEMLRWEPTNVGCPCCFSKIKVANVFNSQTDTQIGEVWQDVPGCCSTTAAGYIETDNSVTGDDRAMTLFTTLTVLSVVANSD